MDATSSGVIGFVQMKWKRVGCAPSTWLLINLRTEETENTVWWPWQPFKCKDETLVLNLFLAKHSIRRFLPSKTLISISAQKSAVYLNLQPRRTCSYFTTYSASPYPCMSSAYKSVPPLENTEHTPIYIYVLRLRALKGKTDFIRFIRKWQLFGDFYTILSFPAFDIFGTCSNRYHFNTFRGKFGFRSRVKLSLGIVKNL